MTQSAADIFVKPVQARRIRSSAQLRVPAGDVPTIPHSSSNKHLDIHQNDTSPTSRGPDSWSNDTTSDTASINSRLSKSGKVPSEPYTAASMVGASASGVGGFFKHFAKGFLIDMPVAFAEGSRAVPKLYGEEVADYGTVKDWKSGFVKSGKNLAHGLGGGFTDLVVQPYEGAKEKGVIGGITGVGKGLVGFSSKASSGKFIEAPFFAWPFHILTAPTFSLLIDAILTS